MNPDQLALYRRINDVGRSSEALRGRLAVGEQIPAADLLGHHATKAALYRDLLPLGLVTAADVATARTELETITRQATEEPAAEQENTAP